MQTDFLKDLEFLGVTARLKRLSEALSVSIKQLYRANGVDLEPSWHLVLLYLSDRSATLSEIAASLRLSQPAATKMINRMADRGYLEVVRDDLDTRRKNIRLSSRARGRLPEFERIWEAGQAAVREILGADTVFLDQLEKFESRISSRSLSERALERLERPPEGRRAKISKGANG